MGNVLDIVINFVYNKKKVNMTGKYYTRKDEGEEI